MIPGILSVTDIRLFGIHNTWGHGTRVNGPLRCTSGLTQDIKIVLPETTILKIP